MENSIWLFFLAALATYRLALMGSSEEGPAAIFARLRRQVPSKSNPGRGIRCFNCWSTWCGIVFAVYFCTKEWLMWNVAPLYALALSASAMLLNRFSKNQ